MIGMGFTSFIVLLVISAVVAVILLAVKKEGFGGMNFLGLLVIGWLGAWLGSPVLGNWGIEFESIYIIPAILGAFAAGILADRVKKLCCAAKNS